MKQVDRIVEAIGREGCERLIAHFGGLRLWIRKESSEQMIETLGTEAAAALSRHFSGEYMQVPLRMDDPPIRRQVAELHREGGHTINEIAMLAGVSRRTVFRYLAAKIS